MNDMAPFHHSGKLNSTGVKIISTSVSPSSRSRSAYVFLTPTISLQIPCFFMAQTPTHEAPTANSTCPLITQLSYSPPTPPYIPNPYQQALPSPLLQQPWYTIQPLDNCSPSAYYTCLKLSTRPTVILGRRSVMLNWKCPAGTGGAFRVGR